MTEPSSQEVVETIPFARGVLEHRTIPEIPWPKIDRRPEVHEFVWSCQPAHGRYSVRAELGPDSRMTWELVLAYARIKVLDGPDCGCVDPADLEAAIETYNQVRAREWEARNGRKATAQGVAAPSGTARGVQEEADEPGDR